MDSIQFAMLFVFLTSGMFHAWWIQNYNDIHALPWHLGQWIPILCGGVATFIYAIQWYKLTWLHSIYGNGGLVLLPILVAGVGYLIGLHYIWRKL